MFLIVTEDQRVGVFFAIADGRVDPVLEHRSPEQGEEVADRPRTLDALVVLGVLLDRDTCVPGAAEG